MLDLLLMVFFYIGLPFSWLLDKVWPQRGPGDIDALRSIIIGVFIVAIMVGVGVWFFLMYDISWTFEIQRQGESNGNTE